MRNRDTAATRYGSIASPWLTVREAAERARCGVKTIYREVQAGRLRAARVGGRRALRFRPAWVDGWVEHSATGGLVSADQKTDHT